MPEVALPEAGLVGGIVGIVTWWVRSQVESRRIDKVEGPAAQASADATVIEAMRAAFETIIAEQSKRLDEQSKRMDMLQRIVTEKDDEIRHRDDVIRRLRDHMDAYYRALLELGAEVDPPPAIPVAPERRSPSASAIAEPIVQAARAHD